MRGKWLLYQFHVIRKREAGTFQFTRNGTCHAWHYRDFCPGNGFLGDLSSWFSALPFACLLEPWVADRMTPKPKILRIYRSHGAKKICAPLCSKKKKTSHVLRSLFCEFKTFVSFQGLLPSRDWPSRFRIVPNSEPTPPRGSSAFSREHHAGPQRRY